MRPGAAVNDKPSAGFHGAQAWASRAAGPFKTTIAWYASSTHPSHVLYRLAEHGVGEAEAEIDAHLHCKVRWVGDAQWTPQETLHRAADVVGVVQRFLNGGQP